MCRRAAPHELQAPDRDPNTRWHNDFFVREARPATDIPCGSGHSAIELLRPHLEVVAPNVPVCTDHVEHCLDRLSLATGIAAVLFLIAT
jgi:hypothetical protein